VFLKEYEPLQPGDVPATYANIDLINETVGYQPQTTLEEGLQKFAEWYVKYYNV
jgi:UDP-glucuronate 4-epimerase